MLESCQLLASAWFFRARSGPEPGNGTDSEKSVPMLFFSYPMVNSPPRSSASSSNRADDGQRDQSSGQHTARTHAT